MASRASYDYDCAVCCSPPSTRTSDRRTETDVPNKTLVESLRRTRQHHYVYLTDTLHRAGDKTKFDNAIFLFSFVPSLTHIHRK